MDHGGEQRRRSRPRRSRERGTEDADRIHHRADVVDALLERGLPAAPIGQALAALVEMITLAKRLRRSIHRR